MKKHTKKSAIGYLVALLGTTFIFLLRLIFPDSFSLDSVFTGVFIVIVVAAFYGGQWPGLLTTVATALCVLLWEPERSYDLFSMILMAVAGTITSVVCQRMHDFAQLANQKRKEAVKELINYQSQRVQAFEAAGIGDWEVNLLTKKSSWSQQGRRMWGVEPEIEGNLDLAISKVHPDDRVSVEQAISRAVALDGDGEYQIEFRIIHSDGKHIWVKSKGKTVFEETSDGQKAVKMYGAMTDITLLKETEAEIKRSQLWLQSIMDATPDVIGIYDVLEDKNIYSNQKMAALLGYTSKELLEKGKGIGEQLIHPDDLESFRRFYAGFQSVESGEVRQHTHRVLHKNGEFLWFDDRAVPFEYAEDGRVKTVLIVARNISPIKEVEQQLRESEERYRMTFENAAVGIGHVSLEGHWIRVNERICEITGYSREELLRSRFHDITHSEDLQEDLNNAQLLMKGDINSYTMEKRYFRKDNSMIWIKLTVSLIKNSYGLPAYFISVVEDIQTQKAAEEQLREEDRRKDEFIATLAHELRNPMTPILSALQILKKSEHNPQLFERAKAIMERQLWHMVRLIDDLLDVSRITRNKLKLRREQIPLQQAIQNALESNQPLFQEKSHHLTLDVPEREIFLHADLTRLTQILSNLLTNAAKYTLPGGNIKLSIEQHQNEVVISIKDTGIGIPAEELLHIFEVFVQSENSKEFAQGGLGIGLTLAKKLVEMHDGSITARSDGAGKGSEFIVKLPVLTAKPNAPVPASIAEQASAKPSANYCILVVDDNEDIAESFTTLLRLVGHEVHTAYDGIGALTKAETIQPDVILLDIGLPEMDGHEVAQTIRQKSWGKDTVLIAITGWGQERDKQRSREAGFNAHITKPADPDELLALMDELMNGR